MEIEVAQIIPNAKQLFFEVVERAYTTAMAPVVAQLRAIEPEDRDFADTVADKALAELEHEQFEERKVRLQLKEKRLIDALEAVVLTPDESRLLKTQSAQ
jgi:hypothetical protein